MGDGAVQVMVAAFHRRDGARRALRTLRELHGEAPPGLLDAAAVARGADGRLRVDATPERGGADLVLGALAAGVLGLLAEPSAASVPGGEDAVRLAETLRRGGMETSRLRRLGAALTDASALVAVVERSWTMRLAHVVGGSAYAFVIESLPDAAARELRARPDLHYPAGDGGDAVLAGRANEEIPGMRRPREPGGAAAGADGRRPSR
ncbi:MAG TPA: hypothetical protein VFR81_25150 [Longimicrobium sp.]|nr:hypothetical protein [Longimicrobium sp.]